MAGTTGRHWTFWVLAALIGIATAPLAGLVGAALIVAFAVGQSALAGTGAWIKMENAWMLFTLGFVYALPLAPISALCVPLAYRSAANSAHGRRQFMTFAAFAGLIAPMAAGGLVSVAARQLGPLTIGALYGLLGVILAPVCAWLIWPVLRKMDELVTT
jgi:hypothetical protein